jgi:hypothetical protein
LRTYYLGWDVFSWLKEPAAGPSGPLWLNSFNKPCLTPLPVV